MNMFTASWLPQGRREGRERSEAVLKRRMAALALSHDLETEWQDAKLDYGVDEPDYSKDDQGKLLRALDKAFGALEVVYGDVKVINETAVADKITLEEALELAAPAERITKQAEVVRNALKAWRDLKTSLDKPRDISGDSVRTMERRVTVARATVEETRRLVNGLKVGGAQNYPEAQAAFQSAERQTTAAEQLVVGARTALLRKNYIDVIDLSERVTRMLDESETGLDRVRLASQDFGYASTQAESAVNDALARLNAVKADIQTKVAFLSAMPNDYVMKSVVRLGEARRALRFDPPRYMEALHLAEDAKKLADDALEQANSDVRRLNDSRTATRALLVELQNKVRDLGQRLKKAQAVPRKATAYYEQARVERDHLADLPVETMFLGDLDRVTATIKTAIDLVNQALQLMD